jgi:hypothetical protein
LSLKAEFLNWCAKTDWWIKCEPTKTKVFKNFSFQRNTFLTFQNLPVTLRTKMIKIQKILHADYIEFMCFVWISEQTVTFALYCINWLVFITVVESVYCAIRTGSLYIILRSAHTVYLCVLCGSENKQRLFHCTALTDWFV